ncbi:hypothetical protein PHMEG_00022825 [Phytophthora megakarya]|uniref:Reverse transcriptase n=1 Tax=Phytophthora megakarya TaxID=4795 RepID=A0A225VIJ3_9STRA|nr:hypothetical protein PHMEG_00022825 [Phytophthora megakarya]
MGTDCDGRPRSDPLLYLVISNIGEETLPLDHRLDVDMILDQDKVPRSPGFVSVGSRRYREWQNLVVESSIGPPEVIEDLAEPAVQRPSYPTPRSILRRPGSDEIDRDRTLISTLESRPRARRELPTQLRTDAKLPICPTVGVGQRDPAAEGATATTPQDAEDDEEIYYHDSGDLSAEDLEGNLAVLPEIPISTTAKVSIEDLQVGDSGSATGYT